MMPELALLAAMLAGVGTVVALEVATSRPEPLPRGLAITVNVLRVVLGLAVFVGVVSILA